MGQPPTANAKPRATSKPAAKTAARKATLEIRALAAHVFEKMEITQ